MLKKQKFTMIQFKFTPKSPTGWPRGTTRFSKKISERINRELFDEKWFSELTLSLKARSERLQKSVGMTPVADGASELKSFFKRMKASPALPSQFE